MGKLESHTPIVFTWISFDFPLNTTFFFQQLTERTVTTSKEYDEVDASNIREEYESKMQEALQEMREQHDRQLQEVRGEVETIYERQVRWTFNIHTFILDLFFHQIIPLDRFVKWVENFKEHNCIFWEETLAASNYRYAWWNSRWKQCWPCILSMFGIYLKYF